MRKILHEHGHYPRPGCSCKSKIRQMNAWGVDGCREHIDEIVDWLVEAAADHGKLARIVVRLPGVRLLARAEIRRLVELAIERAG